MREGVGDQTRRRRRTQDEGDVGVPPCVAATPSPVEYQDLGMHRITRHDRMSRCWGTQQTRQMHLSSLGQRLAGEHEHKVLIEEAPQTCTVLYMVQVDSAHTSTQAPAQARDAPGPSLTIRAGRHHINLSPGWATESWERAQCAGWLVLAPPAGSHARQLAPPPTSRRRRHGESLPGLASR